MKPQIVVTSSSHLPRFCAGVSFTGAMTFPADKFSKDQLKEIIADRLLTVVAGVEITHDNVDEFVDGLEAATKGAKAK